MPAPKKKKPAKRVPPKKPPDEIRDHGDVVTAPAGTAEDVIVARLAGTDKLPPVGQELGRAPKKPAFDPHEGREFGDKPEPMLTTMVFMGIDRGGTFEDSVNALVTEAEELGLLYITATISHMDVESHLDRLDGIADEVQPTTIDTDDEPELDGNEDDYGEPI